MYGESRRRSVACSRSRSASSPLGASSPLDEAPPWWPWSCTVT